MKYDTSPRIRGRKLQDRRLRVWAKDPHCAGCRRLVEYPAGFHLDHVVALANGGEDTDGNCQVLCPPCHESKTAKDMGYVERVETGPDGWPVCR